MSQKFDPDRITVVAIGIEAYEFSDKSLNLNGPARHAVEFVKLAKDAGVRSDKIHLFLSVRDQGSTDAALDEIGFKDRVRTAGNKLEEFLVKELAALDCDLLYFYWCGHGAMLDLDRRLFYEDASDVRYHNLSVSELLHYLHSSKCNHKWQVGFLDACAERVDLEAKRLAGPTAFWVGNEVIRPVARPQFFYYAAAPWTTAQSVDGVVYFSRAVLDVLRARPGQLLEPQPDVWKDAFQEEFKKLWPAQAADFRPVTFLEFADGHVRSTVLVEGFNPVEREEIRRAAGLRGWSMEVASTLVKELAVDLDRRGPGFCDKLIARFRQITNLELRQTGSVAAQLLCGSILEKKLDAFLAGLREVSEDSAGTQAFKRLCRHADVAAELRDTVERIGLALARWQAIYKEWTDRDVALPQSLGELLFEGLNSYTEKEGAVILYLAARAAQQAPKAGEFLRHCRDRWPDAVSIAEARLKSRRQGNQNYITLEISSLLSRQAAADSLSVERAWYQAASDPQPVQADQELLAERQKGKTKLGERVYSVVRGMRNRYFKHVDDPLLVLEIIVDAPLLLFDPDVFECSAGHVLSLFNVALRWRDRLNPGKDDLEARESWEELAGRTWVQVRPTEKVTCKWLPWDEKNMVVQVRDHIHEAIRCASPRSLLVGLEPDGDLRKLSAVLSASGAPFACWHLSRVDRTAADIPGLLGETILEELPHALRQARVKPNGLERLALLCDDPERDPYRK